jgi:hypothetical protein
MAGTNEAVGGTKRGPAGQAMSHKQSIKRVAGPIEFQRVADKSIQRKVVNNKSSIVRYRVDELGIGNGKPPNFSQKLDFKKGNRGDTSRPISV